MSHPEWDYWMPKLIYAAIAFVGAAFGASMILLGILAPVIKSQISIDSENVIAALALIVAAIALIMQVSLTKKTNEISLHVRTDELRRDQRTALLKAHSDAANLYDRINVARYEMVQIIQRGPVPEIDWTGYNQAAFAYGAAKTAFLANKLQLSLLFGKLATELNDLIESMCLEAVEHGVHKFAPKEGSEGYFLQAALAKVETKVREVWNDVDKGRP